VAGTVTWESHGGTSLAMAPKGSREKKKKKKKKTRLVESPMGEIP